MSVFKYPMAPIKILIFVAVSGLILYLSLYDFITSDSFSPHKSKEVSRRFPNLINVFQQYPFTKYTVEVKSFVEVLQRFPWDSYNFNASQSGGNLTLILDEFIEAFIRQALLPFLIMEPKTPINSSCSAPLPLLTNTSECTILNNPRKIGVMLQFGFDVDTLEIHLNELYDIVDQFFITESTRTHFRTIKKPLIWEQISGQPRFSKFLDKITHFVLDDCDTASTRQQHLELNTNSTHWGMESIQEHERWTKLLQWNNGTNFFASDDLLGFGDTDEIPNRNVINHLKNCELEADPIDIGIWFPFGNIYQAFRTDFPVKGHPYTLGDPTYWRLKTAQKFYRFHKHKKYPSRNRGKSPAFMLGGIHMTHYGYLPFLIVKTLSQTETSVAYLISDTIKQLKSLSVDNLKQVERKFADVNSTRIVNLTLLYDINIPGIRETAILPWFYDCNRQRYPAWERKHDNRLD